ncbi:MAG: hypothetical protein ABFS10_06975 [Bacteroidota bacterium]
MRYWIVIIITSLMLAQNVSGQDQAVCNQLLNDAREAYGAGMVELVPELLNDCIEEGLTGTAKQDAYILVITSYLFDYLPDQADTLMSRFLDEFPYYLERSTDPSEFIILLNKHKEQRAAELEAQRSAEEQQEEQGDQKDQETEQEKGASSMGLGFMLGTNLSMPQLIEPYSISDPNSRAGAYGVAFPGFHVGATWNLQLSRRFETSLELQYQWVWINYSASPYDFTTYEMDEYQHHITLPASVLFHLTPEGKNKVYLRLGVMADYMLSASTSAVRSNSASGETTEEVTLEAVEVTSARSPVNMVVHGGAGIRFPLQRGYIFVESRFQYGVLMANEPSKRYDNPELIWLIYHVDNDFKLHQLNISAGMVFNLN